MNKGAPVRSRTLADWWEGVVSQGEVHSSSQWEGLPERRADVGVSVNLVFSRTALLKRWTILRTFGLGGREGAEVLGV